MQISAQVSKRGSSGVGNNSSTCSSKAAVPSNKKKLLDGGCADAELTLKLLKITPKDEYDEQLQVKRSDSEFLKDFYNSTNNTATAK